jgi:hypothetical protein
MKVIFCSLVILFSNSYKPDRKINNWPRVVFKGHGKSTIVPVDAMSAHWHIYPLNLILDAR